MTRNERRARQRRKSDLAKTLTAIGASIVAVVLVLVELAEQLAKLRAPW